MWVFEEEYYIIHDYLLPGFYIAVQFFFTLTFTLLLVSALLTIGVFGFSRDDDRYMVVLLSNGAAQVAGGKYPSRRQFNSPKTSPQSNRMHSFCSHIRTDRCHHIRRTWRWTRLDAALGTQRHGLGICLCLRRCLHIATQRRVVHGRSETRTLQAIERNWNARGERVQCGRRDSEISTKPEWTHWHLRIDPLGCNRFARRTNRHQSIILITY